MKQINLAIQVEKAFGNLYRKRSVLLVVENNKQEILLGSKPTFYPPNVSRLIGGGVDEGEDVKDAAVREIYEELQIHISTDELEDLKKFIISATDESGKVFETEIFVYYVNIGDRQYSPGDDIASVVKVSRSGLHELAMTYRQFPGSMKYVGIEGEFRWHDYGKIYSVIHEEAARYLNRLK